MAPSRADGEGLHSLFTCQQAALSPASREGCHSRCPGRQLPSPRQHLPSKPSDACESEVPRTAVSRLHVTAECLRCRTCWRTQPGSPGSWLLLPRLARQQRLPLAPHLELCSPLPPSPSPSPSPLTFRLRVWISVQNDYRSQSGFVQVRCIIPQLFLPTEPLSDALAIPPPRQRAVECAGQVAGKALTDRVGVGRHEGRSTHLLSREGGGEEMGLTTS